MAKKQGNNSFKTIRKQITSNVIRIRKEQDISQRKLAMLSGIDRSYIKDIENGDHNISIRKLCDIAEALESDIEDLLKVSE